MNFNSFTKEEEQRIRRYAIRMSAQVKCTCGGNCRSHAGLQCDTNQAYERYAEEMADKIYEGG